MAELTEEAREMKNAVVASLPPFSNRMAEAETMESLANYGRMLQAFGTAILEETELAQESTPTG